MSPPDGDRSSSGSGDADRGRYWRPLLGSVGFVAVGVAMIATAGSGMDLLAGWLGLLLGLVGIVGCAGVLLGWITPRTERPRPAPRRRSPAGPVSTAAVVGEPADRPVPQLSEPGKERVTDIVAALHAAGVFAPDAPDPAHLYEAAADYGEPITIDEVLAALHEADCYHPDFRPERCRANLVFHDSHSEQHDEDLRRQIGDLVRLAAGALEVSVIDIRLEFVADGAVADHALIRLSVNGDQRLLDYVPSPKYLSTVIHAALARALQATDAPRRLGWLWCDQGVWITALPDDGVERLNRALGLDTTDLSFWEWVDEQAPVAAGDGRS